MADHLDRRWFGTMWGRFSARQLGRIAFPEAPDEVTAPPAPPAPVETVAPVPIEQTSWWLRKLPVRWDGLLRWTPWRTGLLLYLGAALLLLFNLDWHPPVYFNWEEYTAWGIFNFLDAPTLAHFAPTDGPMTDSGYSPLVVGPVLLGWHFLGTGDLLGMRLPLALIAALAVPLCWRFGRRFIGESPALLAAVLLALSPVFLLYGRTATNVGLSLVPALGTAWLLLRVLDNPTFVPVLLLQLALIADGFAYAPIRFLWPIALATIALEMLLRPRLRLSLATALAITLIALPAWLWGVASWEAQARGERERPVLRVVLKSYYNGRGEQVIGSGNRLPPLSEVTAYVGKNAQDSLRLFFDRDTKSVITDFWNPHGRLQPTVLILPSLLGLACVGWRARRSREARLLLLLFAGFWLPLLLTSQVHVGRLIYVVPLLALLAAEGVTFFANALISVISLATHIPAGSRSKAQHTRRGVGLRWIITGLVVAVVASGTWADYRINPPVENLAREVLQMQAYAPKLAETHRAAVLVLIPADPQTEAAVVSGYRLRLERSYRFIDLSRPTVRALYDPADPRPPLIYSGNLARALDQEGLCTATYFTVFDLATSVSASLQGFPCVVPPTLVVLAR